MTEETPPIPAATLVIFRERDGEPPALLMVERASGMAFAGGMLVFPGGRVDAGDRALAERFPAIEPEDAAARICAIRETVEESGLAIGFVEPPDAAGLANLRASIHEGADFAELIDRGEWALDLDALAPFARWCPNFKEMRVFDTRFYLARLTDEAAEASADGGESMRLIWASAAEVLAMTARDEARVIFPTRRNLERLATLGDFQDATAHAARFPVRLIKPWVEERSGAPHLCIPDDLGYPVTSEELAAVRRG